MSSKFSAPYRGAVVRLFCLGILQSIFAQGVADYASQELVLATIGNGKTLLGHDMAFRLYKAPDGTTGRVDYVTFSSHREAHNQIEEWIKLTTTIKSREHYDNESGHRFNDRILAEWKSSTDQGGSAGDNNKAKRI